MKIAVYTIAKNEEQFVQKWADTAKDADYLIIADTGSTDKTVELAESLGVTVVPITVDPWRFDVARQLSLDAIPEDADVCIALDMDEVFGNEDWRKTVEDSFVPGVTRLRYEYTWAWNEDGSPRVVFSGEKIHSRHGYKWTYPVHEVLIPVEGFIETQNWSNIKIHHYPDPSKPRAQYLPLLKLAVEENPDDSRNAHYLAREYFFYGMKDEAEAEFKRHLALPTSTWKAERAASMRYLYKITGDTEWLVRAGIEAPEQRESFVDLSMFYYEKANWQECLSAALAALKIRQKNLEYITEDYCWGALPHDLAAISSFQLGLYYEALGHGKKAVELTMGQDPRLVNNMTWYLQHANY
jgi:glycosyltransferase involved in cell wall biosynthesis